MVPQPQVLGLVLGSACEWAALGGSEVDISSQEKLEGVLGNTCEKGGVKQEWVGGLSGSMGAWSWGGPNDQLTPPISHQVQLPQQGGLSLGKGALISLGRSWRGSPVGAVELLEGAPQSRKEDWAGFPNSACHLIKSAGAQHAGRVGPGGTHTTIHKLATQHRVCTRHFPLEGV